MGERLSRWRALVGVFTVVLVVVGCAFPEPYPEIPRHAESGGQTQAELDAKLATIPGLIFEKAEGSEPNIKGNTGYGYRLTLDPDYRITDPERLVDFLVESAWSVRDGYQPNSTIRMTLFGAPEDGLNLGVVGEQSGWVPIGARHIRDVADNGYTSVTVSVDPRSTRSAVAGGGAANRERLGLWPGDAPEVPSGVTERRTNN